MNWELFRERLRQACGLRESPHRFALAWAFGVGISLSPWLGVHTLLALAVAMALRLNKVDVLLGTLLINPWTLAPYSLLALSLGSWITRLPLPGRAELSSLLHPTLWLHEKAFLAPVAVNWLVGASLISFLGGFATYFAVRAFASTFQVTAASNEERK